MWDLKTGLAQFMIQGHRNTGALHYMESKQSTEFLYFLAVTSVDLSLDGKQLATGSGDCEVRVCK